ncbi:MAG: serine hydrolase domain-containing protein [Bryobacteraceae bacterium]
MGNSRSRRDFPRRGCFGIPLAVLGGCSGARSRGGPFADLERQAADSAARNHVPGVSLAVIRNAKLVWTCGIGVRDRASGSAVSDRTIFEAASMSKPVFAYAVMQLHERGVIDLDTPLVRYTPERYVEGDPRLDLISARHVLSHTCGFPDIRSRANPLRIQFRPGAKWQYSGEGYAYLQSVVTRLAGRTFDSPCGTYEMDLRVCATDFDGYMRANVLRPLGMGLSGYVWHAGIAKALARPHDEQGRPLPEPRYTAADAARYGSMGGLLTTAADYARFLIATMDPRPADSFRLGAPAVARMLAPQVKVEAGPGYEIWWALGWKVAKTAEYGELVSHGGDQQGFHSLAEMSPARKSGYVILTNGEKGWKLIQELSPAFARRVHRG